MVIQTLRLAKLCFCCCSCNKHSIHQSVQRKYGLECSFNQFKQTGSPPCPVCLKACEMVVILFDMVSNVGDLSFWSGPVITWIKTMKIKNNSDTGRFCLYSGCRVSSHLNSVSLCTPAVYFHLS